MISSTVWHVSDRKHNLAQIDQYHKEASQYGSINVKKPQYFNAKVTKSRSMNSDLITKLKMSNQISMQWHRESILQSFTHPCQWKA